MIRKSSNRLLFLSLLFTLGFAILFARISWLTFSEGLTRSYGSDSVIRGPILDSRGLNLAITEEGSTIGLAPGEIVDPEFTARVLGEYLQMEPESILKKLYTYQNRKFFYLKRQVDNFTAFRILELNLPGVYRESEYSRIYPGETLASNLLGFVGRDQNRALAGIERVYNRQLTASHQSDSRMGPSLYLTIDSLMQYRLEQSMEKMLEGSRATRATGILMNIQTGEILALANFPTFNPNEYWKSTPADRGNWAIRLNYEPGSTVKIFMAGILLSEGAVEPGERILCDGEFRMGDVVIRDMRNNEIKSFGRLNLEEILQHSSNVGIIKAMQRIERERLYLYMNSLGFGQKTGILPEGSGETSGYLPDLKNWVPSSSYYYPIGQGFSVTPIQLLRAGASLGNGGKLVQPYIARKLVSPSGTILDRTETEWTASPFSNQVNRQVLGMMRKVVQSGTGVRADAAGIQVAGKTGTGQKSTPRGYTDEYVASFLGLFPAENPRYAGLILYDGVGNNEGGGSIAAPAFRETVESILPLIREGSKPITVEPLTSLDLPEVNWSGEKMPDLTGLPLRHVLKKLSVRRDLSIQVAGSGYVYRQKPSRGTVLEEGAEILIFLDDLE